MFTQAAIAETQWRSLLAKDLVNATGGDQLVHC